MISVSFIGQGLYFSMISAYTFEKFELDVSLPKCINSFSPITALISY